MPRQKRHTPTHADGRSLKITFGTMRGMGVRGVLVYCHCGHHVALDTNRWGEEVRLSDIEPQFVCQGCGSRGADVWSDFERGNPKLAITGMKKAGPVSAEIEIDRRTSGSDHARNDQNSDLNQ